MNALAPGLNTIPFTSVSAERETPVVLDKANVAVSDGPLGTVFGIQFVAVFQSPVAGLACHVALPAKLLLAVESRSSNIATVRNNNGNRRRGRRVGTASDINEERRVVFIGEVLLIVENDLRSGFVELKLSAHLLDLRCLLVQTLHHSLHSFLLLRDSRVLFHHR